MDRFIYQIRWQVPVQPFPFVKVEAEYSEASAKTFVGWLFASGVTRINVRRRPMPLDLPWEAVDLSEGWGDER